MPARHGALIISQARSVAESHQTLVRDARDVRGISRAIPSLLSGPLHSASFAISYLAWMVWCAAIDIPSWTGRPNKGDETQPFDKTRHPGQCRCNADVMQMPMRGMH